MVWEVFAAKQEVLAVEQLQILNDSMGALLYYPSINKKVQP